MKQNIHFSILRKFSILVLIFALPFLVGCTGHSGLMTEERFEMGKSRIMAKWDLDQDGEITCADAVQKQKQQFTSADLNGSDTLDVEEFKQAPWSNPAFAGEHLYLFDSNHDGIVSRQEFEDRPNAKFISMDRNQDCNISDSEIALMLSEGKSMRASRGGKKGKGKGRGQGKGQHRNVVSVGATG